MNKKIVKYLIFFTSTILFFVCFFAGFDRVFATHGGDHTGCIGECGNSSPDSMSCPPNDSECYPNGTDPNNCSCYNEQNPDPMNCGDGGDESCETSDCSCETNDCAPGHSACNDGVDDTNDCGTDICLEECGGDPTLPACCNPCDENGACYDENDPSCNPPPGCVSGQVSAENPNGWDCCRPNGTSRGTAPAPCNPNDPVGSYCVTVDACDPWPPPLSGGGVCVANGNRFCGTGGTADCDASNPSGQCGAGGGLLSCIHTVTVQYLYQGVWFEAEVVVNYQYDPTQGQSCVIPTEAEVTIILDNFFLPLPPLGPGYTTGTGIPITAIADQCPNVPGNQSYDDFVSGGYTRAPNGDCVVPVCSGSDVWCPQTNGCLPPIQCPQDGICSVTNVGECNGGDPTTVNPTYTPPGTPGTTYTWTCQGINPGAGATDASCSKTMSCPSGTMLCGTQCLASCGTAGVCGPAAGQNIGSASFPLADVSTNASNISCTSGGLQNFGLNGAGGYSWECQGDPGVPPDPRVCTAFKQGACTSPAISGTTGAVAFNSGSKLEIVPPLISNSGNCEIKWDNAFASYKDPGAYPSDFTRCRLLDQDGIVIKADLTPMEFNFCPGATGYTDSNIKKDKYYTLQCWDGVENPGTTVYQTASGVCRVNTGRIEN